MTKLKRKTCGFTLIEAMVVLVILSIISVAASVGLAGICRGPYADETQLAISNALVDKMETLKGTAYASLASGSDTVTLNGKSYTRTWTVANANPNGSGNQTSFDQVSVTIGSQTITTWISQP
jgi:prepilin-type N-terminal cleavage/methylation domain-containing protein